MKKSKIITILSFLVIISACTKQEAEQVFSKTTQNNTFVTQEMGASRGLVNYIEILKDFDKPYDAVVHIQSSNTLGNDMDKGLPSISISAGSSIVQNTSALNLKIDENSFSSKNNSLVVPLLENTQKQQFLQLYGKNHKIILTSQPGGTIINLDGYFPIQPKVSFPNLGIYKPGVGISSGFGKPLNINWQMDPTNSLGGVVIEVHKTNNQSGDSPFLYYVVSDNGNYTIPAADLQKFKLNDMIDVSVTMGSYIRNPISVGGVTKSVLFYTVFHTHAGVTLK